MHRIHHIDKACELNSLVSEVKEGSFKYKQIAFFRIKSVRCNGPSR
jgi:hypothetical protein